MKIRLVGGGYRILNLAPDKNNIIEKNDSTIHSTGRLIAVGEFHSYIGIVYRHD